MGANKPNIDPMIYLAMFDPVGYMKAAISRELKPGKPVKHQQTCPICGRNLVNLYYLDGVWKCRQCWNKGGDA